jgi:nucleoid-associated protein YgaU
MTAISIGRTVLPSLALVAAGGAALFFGIMHLRSPTTVAPAIVKAASDARDRGSVALMSAQAETTALAEALPSAPLPDTDKSLPVFDVARIAPTGEAVIAGRAAPGAIVELLRNGEPYDRTVADQAGQFVLVPPVLPPGKYELTLRSRQPDGTQADSKKSVAVLLEAITSNPGATDVPLNVPETAVTNRSVADQVVRSEAHLPSDGGEPSIMVVPKAATTIVSRGDSLWRISRVTYGAGMRYATVFKANRDKIRNPNQIYPGQIFVLPLEGR